MATPSLPSDGGPPNHNTPRGARRRTMDAGEGGAAAAAAAAAAAGLEHATGICNRLYNFFVRHFASQGTKLVTLGRRRRDAGAAARAAPGELDLRPAASGSTTPAGTVRTWGDVPIGDAAAAAGRKANINERSDAFIRSRKEALRSETAAAPRRSPPPQ